MSSSLNITKETIMDLIMLIAQLTDKEECRYDHHGYCQTHSLDLKPCPHERAKELIDIILKNIR